jgi:iron complex transport system substrate-binding protein
MNKWLTVLMAAAILLAGCARQKPRASAPAPRVVSYSPAMTDMLIGMGLGAHIVGVTTQCDMPPGEPRPDVVGDANTINIERVLATQPDIVLIQMKSPEMEELRRKNPAIKVEHFTIETLPDVAAAMERLGKLLGEEAAAGKAVAAFNARLQAVRDRVAGLGRPRTIFLYGVDSPSTPGRDSFVHEMIETAGGEDAASALPRWTQIDRERIIAMRPEILICQAEPGEERRARDAWLKQQDIPAARAGRVFVVTDRHWTIPSWRLAEFTEQMAEMIHPSGGAVPKTTNPTTEGAENSEKEKANSRLALGAAPHWKTPEPTSQERERTVVDLGIVVGESPAASWRTPHGDGDGPPDSARSLVWLNANGNGRMLRGLGTGGSLR